MELEIDQKTIDLDKKLFQEYLDQYYSKTQNTTGHIKYGTAGFRSHSKNLPHVCLRVGIFTGLVAKLSNEKVLGMVITASHNPQQDNGLKQSDFDGGMIRKQFEDEVSKFVIEQDLSKAISDLKQVLKTVEGYSDNNQGMVFLGRDTRESGKYLSELMTQGIQSVGGQVKDFGEVTTPIIHWLVRYFNLEKDHGFTRESKVEEIFAAYHNTFIQRFNDFYANLPTQYQKKDDEYILLDCSNGIGGQHIIKFIENMSNLYNVIPINKGELQYLNEDCGAEFVHKKQFYPRDSVEELKKHNIQKVRCLAFDGDADRIVYYLPVDGFKSIRLLDGDRIISLFALMFQTIFRDIQNLFNEIKQEGDILFNQDLTKWQIAMVQTPYANGSSTEYLANTLKVITKMSPNGVKNLHPRAHKYDIGIYCESNGHGTFVVSDEKMEILKSFKTLGEELLNQQGNNEKVQKFVKLLNVAYNFAATQNQIMGDAMTNFLCIEQALAYLQMSAEDWEKLYTDKKCLNSTVVIRDRSKIKVSETEDTILEPQELQQQINEIVAKHPGSRSFARPSGTEDIVRVYVEHQSKEEVDLITKLVSEVVVNNKTIN